MENGEYLSSRYQRMEICETADTGAGHRVAADEQDLLPY